MLAALAGGEAMTAGQVADKTGLARPTVSTTLSKLAKTGEVQKAERGYRLRRGDAAPRRRSSKPASSCSRASGGATVALVLPLGFRFDVDAVLIGGVAHRSGLRAPAATVAGRCGLGLERRGSSRRAVPAGVPESASRRSRRC